MGLAAAAGRGSPGLVARVGGVLTYGQPRVGDSDYAKAFGATFGAITRCAAGPYPKTLW